MLWVLTGRKGGDERERKGVWGCVLSVMVDSSVGAWSCAAPDWWVQVWCLDLVSRKGVSGELR